MGVRWRSPCRHQRHYVEGQPPPRHLPCRSTYSLSEDEASPPEVVGISAQLSCRRARCQIDTLWVGCVPAARWGSGTCTSACPPRADPPGTWSFSDGRREPRGRGARCTSAMSEARSTLRATRVARHGDEKGRSSTRGSGAALLQDNAGDPVREELCWERPTFEQPRTCNPPPPAPKHSRRVGANEKC